jgi:putative membrane protein
VLLRLSARNLALYGIIENRGFFVIAAAMGLLSEFRAMPRFIDQLAQDEAGRGVIRRTARAVFAQGAPSIRAILIGVAVLVGFLLISRVFSILWALIKLNGYSLIQVGEDLRAEYGLFTRVTATVPLRRIQAVIVRDTPLHRWLGQASVRVTTAGGTGADREREQQHREWLAPIIRRDELPGLLASLMPGVDVSSFDWRRAHPKAFRRVLFRRLVGTTILTLVAFAALGTSGLWLVPLLVAWAFIHARRYVSHLAWTVNDDVVAAREGAFVRTTSIAALARIQCVERFESPFDRRMSMGRVHADTAGAGGISLPYLPRETAETVYLTLSAAAAHTTFRW